MVSSGRSSWKCQKSSMGLMCEVKGSNQNSQIPLWRPKIIQQRFVVSNSITV